MKKYLLTLVNSDENKIITWCSYRGIKTIWEVIEVKQNKR